MTGNRWIKINRSPIKSLEYEVKDLIEGETYVYRILAENKAGLSKPSEECEEFTAKDPYAIPGKPGRPDIVELHADSADLNWKEPENDGGAAISNYVIEYRYFNQIIRIL